MTDEESFLFEIKDEIKRQSKERKEFKKIHAKILREVKHMTSIIENKEKKFFSNFLHLLKHHENILHDILVVNENIDETACNILLAIRQNEYLQAYYPEDESLKRFKKNVD